MDKNNNNAPTASDSLELVGYVKKYFDDSTDNPIPIYIIPKEGPPPPGWVKVRVTHIFEANGHNRIRPLDGKPPFEAVSFEDAINPENAAKPG